MLLHTDQSSQYRATDYQALLSQQKIVCSISAQCCCWDNAVVASFFSTLNLELVLDDNRDTLISPHQLQRDLAFWIEVSYNCERRNSTNDHLSPIDFGQQFNTSHALSPVNP